MVLVVPVVPVLKTEKFPKISSVIYAPGLVVPDMPVVSIQSPHYVLAKKTHEKTLIS